MKKQKVLIIEDEKILAMDLKNILTRNGYDCSLGASAEEAISLTGEVEPDIIIMDISLSGEKDGVYAVEEIKQKYDIPVLYLSALSDDKSIKRARKTDPYGLIIKPVNKLELLSMLEIALYKHKMESRLKSSEAKYLDLYDNAPDMFLSIDANTRQIIQCNKATAETLGYTKSELVNKRIYELQTSESAEYARSVMMPKFLSRGEMKDEELQFIRKDKSIIYVKVNASAIRDRQGNIIYSRSIMRDITKLKKTEEELIKQKKLNERIINTVPSYIYIFDIELNKIIFSSPYLFKMFGYTADELNKFGNDAIDILLHPDDRKTMLEVFQKLKKAYDNDCIESEYRFRHKDESWVYVHDRASVYKRTDDGEVLQIIGSSIDITDKKEIEMALNEKNRLNQKLLDAFPFVAMLIRPFTREIVASNKTAKNLGATSGELCYSGWAKQKEPCPWCLAPDLWVSGSAQHKVIETDDAVLDAYWLPAGDNLYMHYAFDITDKKNAENRMKESLEERNILLQEIHHRVKNNLQLIVNLLNIQSRMIGDDEVKKHFVSCQNRIRSIAHIHESLYNSDNLSSLNFKNYLTSLTTDIYNAQDSSLEKIPIIYKIKEQYLDTTNAISIGLLMNEMITNSLKHAFPDNRNGTITIDFNKADNGSYLLSVKDNGIGLPDNFDFKNTGTMGFNLLIGLADQINGDLTVSGKNGTEIAIRFH